MLFAAVALMAACGGGRDPRQLVVEPEAPAVLVGETLALTARAPGDGAADAEWEVQEPYGGGLLHSQGSRVTYVPPEAAGTYHLVLRTPGHKQTVEVQVLPSPALEPLSPRIAPGSSVTFRVRMRGLPRDTAVWTVAEAEGGEITADGRYTAPRRPGVYHVTATSTSDPSASARATVTVGAD
ncbi:hypothetical protein [Mesoterricola silvestris]|uniref:BIG2 domain-containing protein n=1 Tax=Mesoterricola silvestris TaxID=2927979 RepID=A0AA48H0U6_9BACT|nr:hypothetical protein [Mesoterricola silvestris]BDU73963.1 hypothetical protein METEAL_31370 [Mesoterricola silvestris]